MVVRNNIADFYSQPTGNAVKKVACGTIRKGWRPHSGRYIKPLPCRLPAPGVVLLVNIVLLGAIFGYALGLLDVSRRYQYRRAADGTRQDIQGEPHLLTSIP